MDSNIYINNNDVVETYFVSFKEFKIRDIQDKINEWSGRGTLFRENKVSLNYFNSAIFYGKKVEIVYRKKVSTELSYDSGCDDVDETDFYFVEYYVYKQCELSKLCDELLNSCTSIELSKTIKNILERFGYSEEEDFFIRALMSVIKFKKVNRGNLAVDHLSTDGEKNIFNYTNWIIYNKSLFK